MKIQDYVGKTIKNVEYDKTFKYLTIIFTDDESIQIGAQEDSMGIFIERPRTFEATITRYEQVSLE